MPVSEISTQALIFWAVPLLSFAISALSLPAIIRVARHYGIVAQPESDSRSGSPKPLLGGFSIIAAILVPLAIIGTLPLWIAIGALPLCVIGALDDARPLEPRSKLLMQIAVVVLAVALGPGFALAPWWLVGPAIAAFFLLSTVNAFNLIDGLDGLAAGVGIVTAAAITAIALINGQTALAFEGLAIVGALGGFLVFNLHPASIFMGDCGALPMGFLLGAAALQAGEAAAVGSRLPRYVVPVLLMLVPLLDTAIVSVSRMATGSPISRRGLDHSHHRLLALGLPDPRAVTVVWVVASMSAACAVALAILPHPYMIMSLPFIAGAFGLVGLFMIDLTFDLHAPGKAYGYLQGLARLILRLSYKRRITEALLDLALITAAYFGAALIRLNFVIDDGYVAAMLMGLPWIIGLSYLAFVLAGVYRGIWRYAGLSDAIRFCNGAVLAGIFVVITSRFLPLMLSGSEIVLFVVLLLNLLIASRLSFRVLRRSIALIARPSERVLIVGAGEVAEAAARFITSGRNLNLRLVGFVDDDNFKLGKRVHGYRVLGAIRDLENLYAASGFNQLLVADDSIERAPMAQLWAFAIRHQLPVRRFSIRINEIAAQTGTLAAAPVRDRASAVPPSAGRVVA
jgi:UDP-GlcNAc:undecaprenyl-phosphate/decaprenyl-phosphate GlcNAc-1-phosphate transferase